MLVVLVSNEFLRRDNYTVILATLLNILGVSHLPFRSSIPVWQAVCSKIQSLQYMFNLLNNGFI